MIINRLAVKRPLAVYVMTVMSIVVGIWAYSVLPRESFPDITIPFIFVTTTYEGVAPEDVEKLVTIPLERKLKGIDGTEKISSTSEDGLSIIAIKFDAGTDIDDALQKVKDKVDQADSDLPQDMKDDPVVTEANFSDIPILQVVLSGPFSLKRLKDLAEDLRDRFEAVPGVLDAEIVGGLEREIHVLFDLDRVMFYQVPFTELLASVEQGNVNQPGGTMDIGRARYQVRVPADFKHPSEIDNIVAFMRNGRAIYLRDVATIEDSHKDQEARTRIGGQTSVTILIKKRSGENIVRINDQIDRIITEMQPSLPTQLKIDQTADHAKDIRLMVTDLENNIISGLLLLLVVIFAFMGIQSAFFVSLAVPLSAFLMFASLQALGITLNMVVLFSLILSLGMLVDDGIVIVENIYRHMQEGKGRMEAALVATDEVVWPVLVSSLTTAAAFFPLLFWPGIMGEFMKFLPITVILALVSSVFVALVINPVLSSQFQKIKSKDQANVFDRMAESGVALYGRLLAWSLDHRIPVIGSSVVLLVVMVAGFGMFGRGVEFFPDAEPKRAFIRIKAPVGTNLEASDHMVTIAEKIAADYPDIRYVIAEAGSQGGDPFTEGGTGTHLSRITLDFKDIQERSRPSSEIIKEIRQRVTEQVQGAEVRVEKEEDGPPTGKPVNIEITGEDITALGALAAQIRKTIQDIPGMVDLKDDFVAGKPEITVIVDKEKASLLGLSALTVATTVKSAINGAKVGVYREGKEEYDILVKLPDKDRTSMEVFKKLTVSGADGVPIPLTSLAEIRLTSGLGGIHRIDQKRVVTVSADVSGRLALEVLADIDKRLKPMTWPRGYSYQFTGEQEEQDKSEDFLNKAFVAGLFLIFLILVAQFNSVATPFIILSTVILSFIGVFFGLLVTNTAFGIIMTGVGVISLAGVVVKNAIVLIDFFVQLRDQGMPLRQALITCGTLRFRPVILTAITSILGMVPMAVGVSFDFVNFRWDVGGESAQWWGQMASAFIFGLTVSTALTLVVVPVLISYQQEAIDWWHRWRDKSESSTVDG